MNGPVWWLAGQLWVLGVGDLLQMEKATGQEACPGWENYVWVGAGVRKAGQKEGERARENGLASV